MIRRAVAADIPALRGFLEAHLASSMFLLGNLEAHGLNNPTHPHGTTYFLRARDVDPGVTRDADYGDQRIAGVLGFTNGGFLLCQMPGLTARGARDWAALLQGYVMAGMTGEARQVATFLPALALHRAALRMNAVEPLYALDLAALPDRLPAQGPQTRQASAADIPLLRAWFAAYMADTGTTPPGDPQSAAQDRADRAIGSPDLHLLIEDGQPVAMAGINAAAGPAVQVGGVYVPPHRRGRGRAGQVVTGLLVARRRLGAARAILFAASDPAARAYVRIGFGRIGDYRVALLAMPLMLGTAT